MSGVISVRNKMEEVLKKGFEKGNNCCQVCGVDMGDNNPRQLCGKILCDNELLIDGEWIEKLLGEYEVVTQISLNDLYDDE